VLLVTTAVYSIAIGYFCYIPKERIEEQMKKDLEELKFFYENQSKASEKKNNL